LHLKGDKKLSRGNREGKGGGKRGAGILKKKGSGILRWKEVLYRDLYLEGGLDGVTQGGAVNR